MQKHRFIIALIVWQSSHLAMAIDLKTPLARPVATVYQYTAETSTPAIKQGMVLAGGLNWNCTGSRCTISGPWPTPALASCKALASVVGALRSYGHNQGAQLDAAQMAQCNAGLPVAASKPLAAKSPAPTDIVTSPPVSAKPGNTGLSGLANPNAVAPQPAPKTPATNSAPAVGPGQLSKLAIPSLKPDDSNSPNNQNTPSNKPQNPYAADSNPGAVAFGDGQNGRRPPTPSKPMLPGTKPVSPIAVTPSINRAPAPKNGFVDVAPRPGITAAPDPVKPASVSPGRGPVVINAGTLRYTGRGAVVINADTLRYTGRGSVVINADTLRYSGHALVATNTKTKTNSIEIQADTLRYAGRGALVINAETLRYAGRGPVVINTNTLRYAGRGPVVINANTLRYSKTTP
jgi:hypothetical protein